MVDTNEIKQIILEELKQVNYSKNEIVGFIDRKGDIYTVGSDSKILGRLFEILAKPILQRVADRLHMELHESPKQTIYPDFWLSNDNNQEQGRIAIDIKTTYRKTANSKLSYTLGSYTSFLRNGTKNIVGDYSMYKLHLIIGFVYSRNEDYTAMVVPFSKASQIPSPVTDVKYFVAEKYKIAGEKPGSGNTANIGTFPAKNMQDFVDEKGPFAFLGNDVFEDYWNNYPTPSERSNKKKIIYTDLKGYIEWKKKSNAANASLLEEKYKKFIRELELQ